MTIVFRALIFLVLFFIVFYCIVRSYSLLEKDDFSFFFLGWVAFIHSKNLSQ